MKNKYPTLLEIIDAHSWKKDYERYLPLSRFVFRPIGFLLTWIAIRVSLTSEAVTWLSGIVGIAGCLCLMSKFKSLLPIGIGLLLCFNLLDCVDGSIARTMKTENSYGRFLDSVCGAIVDLSFWAVLGVMAYRHTDRLRWADVAEAGPVFWLIVGLSTCFLFAFLSYLERTFNELLRSDWEKVKRVNQSGTVDIFPDHKNYTVNDHNFDTRFSEVLRTINNNIRVRENHYILLIIAYTTRSVDLFIGIYCFYYLLHNVILLIVYSRRGEITRKAYFPKTQ